MISNTKNPWIKQAEQHENFKNSQKLMTELVLKAQKLLNDEKFKDYKKLYEEYHATEIENIMMLSEQDPIKYAFKVRQIVDTLKAYRLLISSIEENASIPIEEVKK
jgi:hypothetical protein